MDCCEPCDGSMARLTHGCQTNAPQLPHPCLSDLRVCMPPEPAPLAVTRTHPPPLLTGAPIGITAKPTVTPLQLPDAGAPCRAPGRSWQQAACRAERRCITLNPARPQEVAIWQLGAGAMPSAASQLVSKRYAGAALSGSNLRANSGHAAWRSGSQAPSASAGHCSVGSSSACTNTPRARLPPHPSSY